MSTKKILETVFGGHTFCKAVVFRLLLVVHRGNWFRLNIVLLHWTLPVSVLADRCTKWFQSVQDSAIFCLYLKTSALIILTGTLTLCFHPRLPH